MDIPKRKRYIRGLLRYGDPQFAPLNCPNQAPHSPCHLIGNGSRMRKPKNVKRKRRLPLVRVQRYLCTTHHRYLSFLPETVLPRLHYAAPVINETVRVHLQVPINPEAQKPHWRTIKRWVRRITGNVEKVRKKLIERISKKSKIKEAHVALLFLRRGWSPLKQVWGLLEAAAREIKEGRLPYHYIADG